MDERGRGERKGGKEGRREGREGWKIEKGRREEGTGRAEEREH